MSTMSVGVDDTVFRLLQKFDPEKEFPAAKELEELELQEKEFVVLLSLDILWGGGCREAGVFSEMTSSNLLTQSTISWMWRPVTEQRLLRRPRR